MEIDVLVNIILLSENIRRLLPVVKRQIFFTLYDN